MNILRYFLSRTSLSFSLLALGTLAHAQAAAPAAVCSGGASAANLCTFLTKIIGFIDLLVPVIFALAFIVFLWGVYRTLILGGANEEKRKEGQQLIMYALIGFVIMFSVWGIIHLLVSTLGFDQNSRPNLPTFGSPTGAAVQQSPSSSNTQNHNCPAGSTYVATYGLDSVPACVDLTTGQPVQ